jgi:hypothetical protein
MTLVSMVLTYYTWGAVCVLLYFLYTIAHFYQRKSGRSSYYSTFLLSIVLFIGATYLYAPLAPALTGNMWGDLLRFAGGTIVGLFGLLLLKFMMGGR